MNTFKTFRFICFAFACACFTAFSLTGLLALPEPFLIAWGALAAGFALLVIVQSIIIDLFEKTA
jgi:hypothetical protein